VSTILRGPKEKTNSEGDWLESTGLLPANLSPEEQSEIVEGRRYGGRIRNKLKKGEPLKGLWESGIETMIHSPSRGRRSASRATNGSAEKKLVRKGGSLAEASRASPAGEGT